MHEAMFQALWVAGSILLPLPAAVVLFKWLNSTGTVEGPWNGLTLKFGGPVALYLVVMFAALYAKPGDLNHFHTYTVNGQITFTHKPDESDPNINEVFVRLIPPRLGLLNQGWFSWEIPVIEDAQGKHFPDLQIDLRDYGGVTVPLGPNRAYGTSAMKIEYDDKARTVTLAQPIVLSSLKNNPTYAPAAGEKLQVIK